MSQTYIRRLSGPGSWAFSFREGAAYNGLPSVHARLDWWVIPREFVISWGNPSRRARVRTLADHYDSRSDEELFDLWRGGPWRGPCSDPEDPLHQDAIELLLLERGIIERVPK